MLRIRSTAALAGLVPAIALALGVVSAPAAARHIPEAGSGGSRLGRTYSALPAAKVSRSALRVVVSRHYGPPANASGYSAIVVDRHESRLGLRRH